MPMNYFYSFYMKCTNSGGQWWQRCVFLPYVKHSNILIKVAIIWLILPVYFLKVCLRKIVWNDVTSNKTWITPSDISVCLVSRHLRENCWFYNCSDLHCKMYHPARNGAKCWTPPPQKKGFCKWADERVRNTQHLKSYMQVENLSFSQPGGPRRLEMESRISSGQAPHAWGGDWPSWGPWGRVLVLHVGSGWSGKCWYTYMCSPASCLTLGFQPKFCPPVVVVVLQPLSRVWLLEPHRP